MDLGPHPPREVEQVAEELLKYQPPSAPAHRPALDAGPKPRGTRQGAGGFGEVDAMQRQHGEDVWAGRTGERSKFF